MEKPKDWNTVSLDEMVKYLREKYSYQSSSDAKCIMELIDFYDKVKTIAESDEPELEPLPEKMPDIFYNGMADFYANRISASAFYNELRKHFGTKPREWWWYLQKGQKFMFEDKVKVFNGIVEKSEHAAYLGSEGEETRYNIYLCCPYTEPEPTKPIVTELTATQIGLLKTIPDIEERLRKLEWLNNVKENKKE